ncbi:hypothetical protein G7068_07485 [Leucobacter viscericola]|uniref:Uncharacterized protein n=1 Tax=Leucobacter viscericola TaxID=2714935 RepID=A0A6G7XF09_9MICO|nr:ATP-binding cassette domain-containing protein [Leucobacter viscericola]QIK63056.1 hypothetical protein G7068_07485 [Leucobacter viscericola]
MQTAFFEDLAQRSKRTLRLEDAVVNGPRGAVFGPLAVESDSAITMICGSRGSGRTALLLVLAGRMRLSLGSAEVLGTTRLAEMRRRIGIAGFADIDALEPTATVSATLRERLAWVSPWYQRTPKVTPAAARELLARAFGDLAQPAADTLVQDLVPADEMLLRIALALTESPQMLVIDDFDELRSSADRQLVADRLTALAATGIRVVLATTDPADAMHFASEPPALIEL